MKIKNFKTARLFRILGLFTFILAIIPMIYNKWILSIILISIAIYLERHYKCHWCNFVFDPRLAPEELVHCPNCGKCLH